MRVISVLAFSALLAAAPAPAPVTVTMKNMKFAPTRITVTRGATVVWKNNDQVPHTVTAADGSWGSPVIEPGGTFRKKFAAAGKFEILCTPHPTMKNTVVVK